MKVLFRIILLCPFISFGSLFSQEEWDFDKKNQNKPLFLDTRAINGQTVKLLEKKVLELRITHRFGEIATNQSYRTLFGLDNSSDIRIGLEYGMTENFMIGGGRSKGAGPFLELWDGFLKLGIYKNKERNIKITGSSQLFFTTMPSSNNTTELTNFTKFSHRLSYHNEILFGFKPSKKITLQISPGFIYRNLVNYQDNNFLPRISSVARIHLFKKVSLILEYYAIFSSNDYRKNNYVNPFGLGIEINTFGHVFLLNFVNSRGIGEGQFLPYTKSRWSEGEFRFGFTIARKFNT
jgi:hypothetical protein